MRIALDECLPRTLRRLLPDHSVLTVQELGATSVKNGALLAHLVGRCEVFITVDRNMRYQQRLSGHPFGVIVLYAQTNRLEHLALLVPRIDAALATIAPGEVWEIGDWRKPS